jgi:hypothetical protein
MSSAMHWFLDRCGWFRLRAFCPCYILCMVKILVLTLLASIPFCGQSMYGQAAGVRKDAIQSQKPQSPAPLIGTDSTPLIVETRSKAKSNEENAKEQADRKHTARIERWTLFFTGVAAGFTGLLVWVGWRGVRAANRTLEAIERQGNLMEIAQSASVGIVGITLVDPKPELNSDDIQAAFERSLFAVTMKNTGSSKALKVRMTVNVIIEGVLGLVTTPEDINDVIASDIHPDVLTERIETLKGRLPNSGGIDWQYATAGRLRLSGTLVYEDIFGNDFETEYTARSLGATQRFPFTVRFELISTEKKISTWRIKKQ